MRKNYVSITLGLALLAIIWLAVLNYQNATGIKKLDAKINDIKTGIDATKPALSKLEKKGDGLYYYNPAFDFELTIPSVFKAAQTSTGVKFGSKIDGYNATNDTTESYGVFYATNTYKPISTTPGPAVGNPENVTLNGPVAIKRTYETAAGKTPQLRLVTYTMNINGKYYICEFEAAKSNATAWDNLDKTAKSFKPVFAP